MIFEDFSRWGIFHRALVDMGRCQTIHVSQGQGPRVNLPDKPTGICKDHSQTVSAPVTFSLTNFKFSVVEVIGRSHRFTKESQHKLIVY